MRAHARLPPPLPISGTAAKVHDCLHPDDVVTLTVDDSERKPAAESSTMRTVEGTAKSRILCDDTNDALGLIEELTPQARRPSLVEPHGLSVLGHCLGMKSDYHPNRARMVVSASSIGMARTAPDCNSSSLR